MADLNALYQALRNADAAGDTEGAKRLAQFIQQSQGQAAPIPEAKPAPFSLADTALSAGQSALGATKSLIEGVTGAGSAPGEYLEGLQKSLGEKLTPERKAEIQRRTALEKQAAETGKPLEEIAAGLGGVKEAPLTTFAQAAGSSVPTVLGGIGVAALGATLGAPAAVAAGVGIAAKYLLGAIQGGGEVKGTIYDAVKDKLMENNVPEATAKRQAAAAQDYLGKNWDTIAQGLGLGAIAGGTGAETELLKRFSKPIAKQIAAKEAAKVAEQSAVKEFGKAVGKESFTEGLQGGQSQYAENKALTREGYLTDAMKGVYGAAARDAAMGAIGGGGIHAIVGGPAETAKPAPAPEPGPQIAPEAPKGTQGTLFTEEEMGKRVPTPKEPAEKPTPAAPQGEQLDLGIDFQRDYADIVKEREALKLQPQTAEVKARIKTLNAQLLSMHEYEIGRLRVDKAEDEATRAKFPGLAKEPVQPSLFPELEIVRPEATETEQPRQLTLRQEQARRRLDEADAQSDAFVTQRQQEVLEGQKRLPLRKIPEGRNANRNLEIPARPDEITMEDLENLGLPMRSAKAWLEQNVVGKTPAEIRVLVGNNPDLLLQKGTRAQVLKYLTAPVPEGFKEEPSVTPTTQTNLPKPRPQPTRSQPSVGISGQPAGTNVVQPGAGVPTTTETTAAPNGLGLAPTGQPAGTGTTTAGETKPALKTQAPEPKDNFVIERKSAYRGGTSEKVEWVLRRKSDNQIIGYYPTRREAQQTYDIYTLPKEEVFAKYPELRPNAPATTPAAPSAPAAPKAAKGPKTTAKPLAAPAAPKETKAPTPAVAAETVEEEAARKAEAEEIKRRLEEVERKLQEKPAAKAEAPAPKAEKPEPKELPEKLREPVGTSEFGMEEGEKEILRGPQGMLFPMSKREELEYAKKKEAAPEEAPTEEKPTKDTRQAELDLQPRKEVPEWATKAAIAKQRYGEIMYADDDIALIRYADPRTGRPIYGVAAKQLGTYVSADSADVYTNFGKSFTNAQLATLRAEQKKAMAEDAKLAAQFPDGPFTNAKSNIVSSGAVDSRYVNYLKELTKSLGMDDVRIFLFHSEDLAKPDSVNDFHLHGRFYTPMGRANPSSDQAGAAAPFGQTGKDFMLFIRKGEPEAETLEVMAHELGHIIDRVAFKNAPAATKKAIMDEYDDWLNSLQGKKIKDLIMSLRNRRQAESMEAEGKIPDAAITQMTLADRQYWMGFDEWFADNVSRWATTADKPLTITEKFFSKVAQMMRDLVAIVTGRKYPPAKAVADFLNNMGPGSADMWLYGAPQQRPTGGTAVSPFSDESPGIQDSVSFSTESLIDSMGPLDAQTKSGLSKLIAGVKANPDIDYTTKFRTQVTDIAATIEKRLSERFDGAVRDSMGKLNPMGLYRQAQDYTKMLLEYFQTGTLYKDPVTGLWKSGTGKGIRPPAEIYAAVDKYAEKNGYSRERATQIASRVLEGVRLDEMRRSNKTGMTNFAIHLKDSEIDQLVKEYNADPDLQAMSKLMDEARIGMVDNLVKVGRLTQEEGDKWKSVIGYVPFDRIEDFASNFNKAKKISGKGLAQLGKLPELVGSINRPVGNVFDNYINTLGWMVGQTLKTDATTTTLRSLEDLGYAKHLGPTTQGKQNTVGGYVNGEMRYWSVPSKYDVMAFKDLNPPKAGWLRAMGAFSNVLRKTVTVLPPFALKQVTDDVQRAILTSGVKNPGALVWMSLTNFPKLALAELRGIQHPSVKEFGRLGLTGEYDFEAGKPAISLLKDLGYKKRGRFEGILHRLDGITRASDLAVRKAIYDQTLKESNDELLAQTRAREFINFRRRGASDFVGAMVTTIPFFNAYIQGMDVLYRAASGKDSSASVDRAQARRMFWSRAATVMMLSSLYALGKDDEDKDYQEMDLRTRDNNWILGGGYKVGVPGELGAIFKVIPERIVEYMKRQGTPEEQTAWEATRTTLSYMFEQYLGRAMPVPQAIKPVLEAWANKSFLTGKDLEGYHHKAMDPSMRMNEQTSELAKAIAVFSRDQIGVEVSPIMIDNALRGYFGSSAAMFTMVTDSLLNPTRVDRPLHKYALLSNYLYDPVGTRRMTEFYEEREKVGKANNTLLELMKTDVDRAEKYAEAHADELQLEGAINSTLEQLERTRAYRKWLNSPEGAADMSKDEREAELKELKQQELAFVQWVREAKNEIRKVQ